MRKTAWQSFASRLWRQPDVQCVSWPEEEDKFSQKNNMHLGLQKINNFWSTPSVLLFLDANSKSRRFGRYLQKPVVSFMPSTATLNFFVIPRPPELIIDFAHGKSLVSNGLSQNKSCIPIRMVMCTHTHSVQTCNHDHASSKNIIP